MLFFDRSRNFFCLHYVIIRLFLYPIQIDKHVKVRFGIFVFAAQQPFQLLFVLRRLNLNRMSLSFFIDR